MHKITLQFPVYTVEQEVLLPAGTLLSRETMEELVSRKGTGHGKTYSLLDHGMVKQDILRLLHFPPYNGIFRDTAMIEEILELMELVRFGPPVLGALDYFKVHDYHTYCHILVVFALSTLLARDLVPNHRDQLRESAISHTHDIGKICVPPSILSKQTPLTQPERELIKHHTAAGYVLLSYYLHDYKHLGARVARDHHERRDGSGHPRGINLSDDMIEIVVVSDIYDALVSPRPYRNAPYDNRTALEVVTRIAETGQIGWEAVKALVAHNRNSGRSYLDTEVSIEKRGVPPSSSCYGLTADARNPTGCAE